jgi:hypothetical protein
MRQEKKKEDSPGGNLPLMMYVRYTQKKQRNEKYNNTKQATTGPLGIQFTVRTGVKLRTAPITIAPNRWYCAVEDE